MGLLGTFLSFFLIVGFLFLLLFAYNTKEAAPVRGERH